MTSGRSSTSAGPWAWWGLALFVAQLAGEGEAALKALNGLLVFRRTRATRRGRHAARPHRRARPLRDDPRDRALPGGARQPDLVVDASQVDGEPKQGAILAAITALKQICNHPAAYQKGRHPSAGRALGQAHPARGDRRPGLLRRWRARC
ncbi:MAG: hypothetical protein R2746_01210 [Acidimicrobiales bacterium]